MNPVDHAPGEWLSAYLDGELGPAEAAAVQTHLEECSDCTDEAARFGRVRTAIRTAAPPVPPRGWEDGLIEKMHVLGGRTVVALRRRVAATAAAVAALVAAAVFTFVPNDPTTSPSVGRMVVSHATSSGAGDPSRLAPAAVTASFGGP